MDITQLMEAIDNSTKYTFVAVLDNNGGVREKELIYVCPEKLLEELTKLKNS